MSYFGIRVKYRSYAIIVRIHGPLDEFEINPLELETKTLEFLESIAEKFNMLEISHRLAEHIANNYCNGNTRLWVETDVDSGNKIICGSSVSKLDVMT